MARSDDGIVEAIWRPGALGVQFHPEMLMGTRPAWGDLFIWLIAGKLR